MKNLRILSLMFFVFALTACLDNNSNKIGFLLHDMEGRWFTDIEYIQKHADEAGVQLVIKNAGGNENVQIEQARELVKEGVGVIMVVAVNQNTAAGIVRIAHNARLKVLAYDRIIINSKLDYLISYQYKEIGRKLAEYAYNKVPKGNYVMLWGDASDNNARLMREGQEEFLKPYIEKGDINLIYKAFVEGWSKVNAKKTLQKVVDFSDKSIDVLMVSNDNMALSALSIFDESNIQQPVVITGQDATLDACRSIVRNGQTMTIYKSTNQMAKESIQLAVDIIKGNKINKINGKTNNNRMDVPTLYMPPIVVDKSNINQTVIADGMYSYNDIYGDE
ncbi:MAG TPA: substrate-binding domain-containing protein [Prolixibacteraceae bacterium]|nr:substrate-binding domain-containing protein [Prolixibacteraceae bacterium]